MNTVKVKICGIRTLEAAIIAVESGAEYLGFNFVPDSRRRIDFRRALEISNKVKGSIQTVGVFQDADAVEVNGVAKQLGLDFVQLHGQENSLYMKQMRVPVIKAITALGELRMYEPDYFLLDRIKQGEGEVVAIAVAKMASKTSPLFLAGGLTPHNVASLVKKILPFAVDVASGIESDGIADVQKIRAFVKNAKGVVV